MEKVTIGFVAIGRNEGERFKRCLVSLKRESDMVVYVDSGSTDESVPFARSHGVEVVELDTRIKFNMSRARNSGWKKLLERWPDIEWVHFIDGDCELIPSWLALAQEFLATHADVVVVCGRRRERHPERSPYNRLCEVEWNTPVGEAGSCGGDALVSAKTLMEIGGFNEDLIAGEEPEMCRRIRARGGRIWRIAADMTLHDANITRLGQWWRRNIRGGYGAADVAVRTAQGAETPLFASQVRSAYRWVGATVALMIAAVVCAALSLGSLACILGAIIVGAWLLQSIKIALGARARCGSFGVAMLYGSFTMLAKWPQAWGILRYRMDKAREREAAVIEYKQ